MTEKPYDDSNWREEYRGYTCSRYELDLLENGPKSLAQSWMMGALHNKWKKMKGYKEPEPPDCSSSLQEWEQSGKKYNSYTVHWEVYNLPFSFTILVLKRTTLCLRLK